MHPRLRVGLHRGRSLPEVIVQFLGHGHVHVHRRRLRVQDAEGHARADRVQLADAPVADQFHGPMKLRQRAELAVGAEDPLVLRDQIAEHAAFGDAAGERLFATDVLARLDRQDRHRHVPMVRRRDHHRIDVLAVQHLAEIDIPRALGNLGAAVLLLAVVRGGPLLGHLQPPAVDVAQRHHFAVGLADEERQVVGQHLPADADHADRDPVAGRHALAQAQGGRGNQVGNGQAPAEAVSVCIRNRRRVDLLLCLGASSSSGK